jgi:uncharacterized protein
LGVPAEFRILSALSEIDARHWDALHSSHNPFIQHTFLSGLEATGCLRPEWGWTPYHPSLWQGEKLLAAAPGYLKSNSHGEFVFDHAWADAYYRAGRDYFPKWLMGIPYSPVSGPRLLARQPEHARALADAICSHAKQSNLSSVHANFHNSDEHTHFDSEWNARHTVQFHWRNRHWADFDAFLAALEPKKRKNIRQERAKVVSAGYTFRIVDGSQADTRDLTAMHHLYQRTFDAYGNAPALTLEFFQHLAAQMPHSLLLILAEREGEIRAGALCMRSQDTLYGRYWGSVEDSPGLHFETCYYQGIAYCLREGLLHFEPGAQGEHKIARGFLPVLTHSHHWMAAADFRQAITPWCASERGAMQDYFNAANAASPYS